MPVKASKSVSEATFEEANGLGLVSLKLVSTAMFGAFKDEFWAYPRPIMSLFKTRLLK